MHEWRDTEIIKLIDLYKQYEFMYDPNHPFYRRTLKREEAYSRIWWEMKKFVPALTLDDVKHEIRLLRVRYNFEKNQVMRAKSTRNEAYIPDLFCYDMLSFLDGFDNNQVEMVEDRNKESEDDFRFCKYIMQPSKDCLDPHLVIRKAVQTIQIANDKINEYKEPKQKYFGQFVEEELEQIKDPIVQLQARWRIQVALREAIRKDQETDCS